MRDPHRFTRLMIDLDRTGGPVGAAYVVYEDDRPLTEVVLPAPGPFDTPLDCLAQLVALVDLEHGRQQLLPLDWHTGRS